MCVSIPTNSYVRWIMIFIHTYMHACIHTYIHTYMPECMHAYLLA